MKIVKLLFANIIFLLILFVVSYVFQGTNGIVSNIASIITPHAYAQVVGCNPPGYCLPSADACDAAGLSPVAICDGSGASMCCEPPPNCNTGVVCGGCQGVGTNTTCNANNGFEACTYTAYTGGGNCTQVGAANQACTINSCTNPSWACVGGVCIPYYTISGNITDVDGNGTPNIPVSGAGCSSSGGAWTFGYGCAIRAGSYAVSENLPANYIAISGTSQGVTVGPNKGGVNFTVARVFSISGTVTDVDGNGTPNITVTCGGHSAAGGAYTIPYSDHIRKGTYACTLNLPANYIAIGVTTVNATVGGTTDAKNINFTVARVFSVSGSITDVDGNGTPAGVTVTCTDTKVGQGGGGGAATEGAGNFTIPYGSQFRRGNVTCTLNLPANYIAINPLSGALPAFALTADKTGVNFTVARVFSITGSITDVDGNGTPAGVTVTCTDTKVGQGGGGGAATEGAGNFTIPYGSQFRRGNVTCTLNLPANYIAINPLSGALPAFALTADKTGVNFTVARVFSITGSITDVDGNGTPAGVTVTCTDTKVGQGGGGGAATEGAGNFTIPYGSQFRRGNVTCTLNLPANYIAINPLSGALPAFALTADKTGVNFTVARVFSITGSITDVDGNGTPAGVTVTCTDTKVGQAGGGGAATEGAGNFTVPYGSQFRRGNVTCTLNLPANYIAINPIPPTIAFAVGPDRTGVNFGVARVFSITGAITDVDGNGTPAGVTVTCTDTKVGQAGGGGAATEGAGNFTVPYGSQFRRGNVTCTLNLPANYIAINPIPPTIAFAVGPDRTGVNFGVARVFSITGTITDVDGNGTPTTVTVTCTDTNVGQAGGGGAATEGAGNFTVPYGSQFRRGNVTCTLNLPANYIAINPNPPTIAFAVGPDRTGVNFGVARVFSISGTVTDPYNGNAGVGGVQITSGGYTVATNGGGAYTVPYAAHLRRGTHPVTLTIPNGWTNTSALTINVTVGPDAVGINFGVTKLFSVAGNVFVDPNIDGIHDPGEVNYNRTASQLAYIATTLAISTYQPNPPSPFTTNTGDYLVNQLISGPFTISFAVPNPPPRWYMTSPLNGPPPSFRVTVGYNCDVNGAPGAACNNGNIVDLDFGMVDNTPWNQYVCGDVRNDSGMNDPVPAGYYASTTSGSCTTSGLIFSGSTNADFGDGQGSTSNQIVGDANYPENYDAKIFSSYDYLSSKATSSNLPEINLSTICNTANCTLPANLADGIYVVTGNLALNAYNFPAGKNYVFLINGDLTLDGNIIVPTSSTATFAVSGNIFVDYTVGSAAQSNVPNLEGIFSADKSVIIDANPANCSDLRLNIQGTVIVNAAQNGGSLQNNRNLCRFNAVAPSLQISQRLDFLFNLPEFVRSEQTVSQEVSP